MAKIEIRKADEADAAGVLEILRSVAIWLETSGPGKLWAASSFDLAEITERTRQSKVVILKADDAIAASMYVETNDDTFWPNALSGEALYLHKIAVDRQFSGLGLSRMLLDWAAQYAALNGYKFLRLDCAPRAKLVQVYTDAGFYRVGEDTVLGGFPVARMQRDLPIPLTARASSPQTALAADQTAPTPTLMPMRTRALLPPKDDLWDALDPALPALQNGDVVAITSKIVAIAQGRCVAVAAVTDKEQLVEAEADARIPKASSKYGITLTIKAGTLIASAGIDASNARGHYILWPDDPWGAARAIGERLKQRHGLTELGVILTDSHCIPLRRGTVGISIGSYGFNPLRDYRGTPDIFGRPLEVTVSNLADAMAAAAVGLMGEGAESIPAVVVRNWPGIVFANQDYRRDLLIPADEDIFGPLLQAFGTLDA